MFKVNRAFLVHFVKTIKTNKSRTHFSTGRLYAEQLLKWITSPNTITAKKIVGVTKAKSTSASKASNLAMFASVPDPDLQETNTKWVCQALRASPAFATYAEKDPLVREFFYTLFRNRQNSVVLINKNQCLQTVLNCTCRGAIATIHIVTLSVFEFQLMFHSIARVEEAIRAKHLKSSRSYFKETIFGYTVQCMSKSWMAFARGVNVALLANLDFHYIFI